MMVMFGQPIPEYQLDQFWFVADSDKDGEISKQELRNVIDTSFNG
jgi:Ca2+-binding EF-hand superfamily protein